MNSDVIRTEGKLKALIRAADCKTCSLRGGACRECGRRVGGVPGDSQFAMQRLVSILNGIEVRLSRAQSTVLSLVDSS